MSGASGLDYTAVQSAFRLQQVPEAEWPQLFEDVRVMEAAALEAMRGE